MMSIEIYIGGYQRSGNTFLARQVENRYGISLDNSHTYNHDSRRHREYVSNGNTSPFLVPIRDAKESLISNYIMSRFIRPINGGRQFDINQQINVIKDLWEFVESEDRFFIAPFEEFTENTESFFTTLEDTYTELKSKIVSEKSTQEVYQELYEKENPLGRNDVSESELLSLGELQSENINSYRVNLSTKSNEDYWISTGHIPRPRTLLYNKVNEIVSSSDYESDLTFLNNLRKKLVNRYYK